MPPSEGSPATDRTHIAAWEEVHTSHTHYHIITLSHCHIVTTVTTHTLTQTLVESINCSGQNTQR